MPFITQGKTNFKYILIIVILAIIVGGGYWFYWNWWIEKQTEKLTEFPEIKRPEKIVDETANWKTYTSSIFGITLKYPNNWELREGYEKYKNSYGGEDGYFSIGPGWGDLTFDEVLAHEVYHRLQPYGSEPIVEILQIQGREARLVLPSLEQREWLGDAVLIIRLSKPIEIPGIQYKYYYLFLQADPNHIIRISETLRFIETAE